METILILDDDTAVRESFVDYFEDCMWRTIQARSAEEAIKLLEKESPVAALVDIRLPGMSGTDFIRTVYKKKPGMAIVICTGSLEYVVPPDLLKLPSVSSQLFRKPVAGLADMEKELLRVIEDMKKGSEYL